MRIVQMARQLMEDCRANKALDERTIAVRTRSPSLLINAGSAHLQRARLAAALSGHHVVSSNAAVVWICEGAAHTSCSI